MPEREKNYRRLIAAILWRAVRDAAGGDAEVVEWLQDDTARLWAELLDLANWPPKDEHLQDSRRAGASFGLTLAETGL